MSVSMLPVNVLVKIFNQLSFKERVRIRGVNQSFRNASEQSISSMRSLIITHDLMVYTMTNTNHSFLSILNSCSSALESIDATDPSCSQSLIKVMSQFVYPQLKYLKIVVIDNVQTRKMISRCGNLRLISLQMSGEFEWPESMAFDNLECLHILPFVDIHQSNDRYYIDLSPILRPLIGQVPNLKQIWIRSGYHAPFIFPVQEFSQLLASAPNLEELNLELSGLDVQPYLKMYQDLEAAISNWHAPKLTTLAINFNHGYDFNGIHNPFPPSIMYNFPFSFPRLKSFASMRITEIDDQAVTALSDLEDFRELRHSHLQVSKEMFIRIVRSLPRITTLEIGAGRPWAWEYPFKIDGQALQAMSQLQNLREFRLGKPMTTDEFIDVVTSVPSMAILHISTISDVYSPEEFLEFLTLTAAQIHRDMELCLWMNVTGDETDLDLMELALEEIRNSGGPVVEVNLGQWPVVEVAIFNEFNDQRYIQSIRYGSVVG